MSRARLVLLAALLFAAPAAAGPGSDAVDARADTLVARVRPYVGRVEGIDPGGRLFPMAGFVAGNGGVVFTWSRLAAPGWRARVVLPGERTVSGKVLARDARTGVTAVKLDESGKGGLIAGNGDLPAGSPVLAAGYPFGNERSDGGAAVSLSLVAQARRPAGAEHPDRYLLTGTVNPGDFGGPLIDRNGRLAGILLAERDETSGLSMALTLAALRAMFPDEALVQAALKPASPPAGSDGGWPVHDALRAAADSVFPAIASLMVKPAPSEGPAPKEERKPWVASGVLVDRSGLVVTTAASVEGAGEITAVFPSGSEHSARVVARDGRVGIALLRLAGDHYPKPAELAPDLPVIGSFVVAVGNPDGRDVAQGPLLSVGIVGARNRSGHRYGALHTDAAVNRANAGGALVDLDGRVVGILSTLGGATLSDYGANSGIGFAIPAPAVAERLPSLSRGESVSWRRGRLGVNVDLEVRPEGGGVKIAAVLPGEAAAGAGIQAGDVIVGANGQEIRSLGDLRRIFTEFEVGEKVKIAIRRGDDSLTIPVTLGEWQGAAPR